MAAAPVPPLGILPIARPEPRRRAAGICGQFKLRTQNLAESRSIFPIFPRYGPPYRHHRTTGSEPMPTEYIIPYADDGHAEGDPPSRDVIEFDEQIDRFIFSFWKVTLPHVDVAFELSWVLGCLRKFRAPFQLDVERRDKLIKAIADAAVSVVRRLPNYQPGNIIVCMSAVAVIVEHWAEDEQQQEAHHPHRIEDAWLHVRMFERDLRNISDYAWLQQRKAQRQQEVVRDLVATAIGQVGAEKVAA
ncbi:hypothetical protein [Mesorhizobium sp. M1406]|uniref:hypothetical protein n=1 Tax=Mesorhizobium sp. M1406 TaxID=2957099 RepID=UPI003336A760